MSIYNFKKIGYLLVLLFLTAQVNAQTTTTINTNDTIAPEYPGGMQAFRKYIAEEVRYSIISQINGNNKGKIIVRFTVDTLGHLIQPKIVRSIDKYYTKEALRVIQESKPWTAGILHGKKENVAYTLPILINGTTLNLKNAYTLLNGATIKGKDLSNKLTNTFVPYQAYPTAFTKALFGPQYNKSLVIIQDFNEKECSPEELHHTLKLLKKVDTTKFDFFVDGTALQYQQWQQLLTSPAIKNINITPAKDSVLLASITLFTKQGYQTYKNFYLKRIAEKQMFLDLIQRYRHKGDRLTTKLIYIDDYQYNTQWILDSLNTKIINSVFHTNPESIVGTYKDARQNGYFQLYTKDYSPENKRLFRLQLLEMIEGYRTHKPALAEDYIYFLNNNISSLAAISEYPESEIKMVHIITKQRAKDIFGNQEQKPIIYIQASSADTAL